MVFSPKLWNSEKAHCANQSTSADLSRCIIAHVYRGFGLQFSFVPLHNSLQVLLHPLHHVLRRDDTYTIAGCPATMKMWEKNQKNCLLEEAVLWLCEPNHGAALRAAYKRRRGVITKISRWICASGNSFVLRAAITIMNIFLLFPLLFLLRWRSRQYS